MLRFESWPPEPQTTFITDRTKGEVSDWMDSITGRTNTSYWVASGIADLLHSNSPAGHLTEAEGQAFYDALEPQIPQANDIREGLVDSLHKALTGRERNV